MLASSPHPYHVKMKGRSSEAGPFIEELPGAPSGGHAAPICALKNELHLGLISLCQLSKSCSSSTHALIWSALSSLKTCAVLPFVFVHSPHEV